VNVISRSERKSLRSPSRVAAPRKRQRRLRDSFITFAELAG